MRKWLIVGAVVVGLIGLIAFALSNLNRLIASNKDRILSQADQIL